MKNLWIIYESDSLSARFRFVSFSNDILRKVSSFNHLLQNRSHCSHPYQDRFPQIPGLKIHCLLESNQLFRWFSVLLSWFDRTPPSQTSHVSMNSPEGGLFLRTQWKSDPMSYIVESKRIKYTFFVRWIPFEQNFNTEYTCDACFARFFRVAFSQALHRLQREIWAMIWRWWLWM